MVSYKAPLMFIAGEWTKGSGKPKDVINPATEEVLAQLPGATEADLDRALESTQRGFKVWSGLSAEARCDIVMKGCQHPARARGRDRAAHHHGAGQAGRGSTDGNHPGGIDHRMGRATGPPRLRHHRAQRSRLQPFRPQAADRARRGLHAVEFPDLLARPQAREQRWAPAAPSSSRVRKKRRHPPARWSNACLPADCRRRSSTSSPATRR